MLVEEQIQVRRERAPDAIKKVVSRPRKGAYGDYEVQSASGKKYRVAMRGPGVFENYCSCPDFAVNTLGTCKHIEALLLRTIPMVAAVNRVANVHYAEIVASIASKSAGPGTRANIDEFTQTTARAIEAVGGAGRGKAIIVLNPADPPLMMRNTIFCLSDDADTAAISASVDQMVDQVRRYVPGYRLKQDVQFERFGPENPLAMESMNGFSGIRSSIYLEIEGSAHYLPAYAGNLDIMTSAALKTAERLAERKVA